MEGRTIYEMMPRVIEGLVIVRDALPALKINALPGNPAYESHGIPQHAPLPANMIPVEGLGYLREGCDL